MPKSTYFLDDRLVPRITQILRSQRQAKSVAQIAEELQAQFSEYGRRKKNVFVKSVEKGYSIAVKEIKKEGVELPLKDSNSDDSDTDSELVHYEDKNILNNMITNMYKKQSSQTPQPGLNETEITSTQSTPTSTKEPSKKRAKENGMNPDSDVSRSSTPPTWYIDRGKRRTDTTAVTGSGKKVASSKAEELSDALEDSADPPKKERTKKRRRESSETMGRKKKQRQAIYSNVTFANVGGNESILQHLEERCQFLEYPELLPKIKGDLPKCFLFHGPTGCGKTLLANAVAGEYGLPLLAMTATEVVGGISGDSEANIRDLFEQAAALSPCVLFVDDVDAIATKRETATKGMESRVVTQLSNSMDELRAKNLPVLMICATNRPNSLDEAFRRTGRFDIEYAMRFPNRDARKSILEALCREVVLGQDVSLSDIADLTPGYVGSDLKTLISITNACALNRVITEHKEGRKSQLEKSDLDADKTSVHRRQKVIFTQEELESFEIKMSKVDFEKAMTEVKPTAKQEDVILVPNTTWDDIGGLDSIRKKLNLCIMERTKRPELYQAIGMTSAAGVLLVGPPGCGKTSVARAVANEAGINFLYIKGAELLNKYVGESEKNVRDLFKRASSLAPCVIFFDEIDAICPRRSSGSDDNSTSRVTNQLLLEMSGLEQRTEVYVIAATNRLDRLDRAFLRPGRMDKIIYVGLPNPDARVEILRALTKNGTRPKLASDVSLERIGRNSRCDGFSGADLGNLIQVARETCLEQIIESTEATQTFDVPEVNDSHFQVAFESVSASVDAESKRNYEAVKKLLEKKTAKKEMDSIDADSKRETASSMETE